MPVDVQEYQTFLPGFSSTDAATAALEWFGMITTVVVSPRPAVESREFIDLYECICVRTFIIRFAGLVAAESAL